VAPGPLAAVVLDTLGAPRDPELDRVVGPGAAQRLRGELRALARRWAALAAPDRAFEATTPGAALMALHDHIGPVVLVAPDVPSLGVAHVEFVRADLAAGAGVVVGATHDASPYLLALAVADPDLLELAGGSLQALMAVAHERGLDLAAGRHERRLATAADARALALDPLAPPELVVHLGNLRGLRASIRAGRAEVE